MKFFPSLVLLFCLLVACFSCQPSDYRAKHYLDEPAQEAFLHKIARYVAKLPKRAKHEDKFDPKYDAYYQEEMANYRVQLYFIGEDSTHYFLIDRPAPSLYGKRVAIGGQVRFNREGGIEAYEEAFHTWKMPEEELAQKGSVLFEEMLAGKDLSKYFTAQSEGKWIEFPDDKNYFDKVSMRWRVRGQDTTVLMLR